MGKMSKLLTGAVLAGGVMTTGCHHGGGGKEWHGDPCWPDRYSNEARKLQVASFEPQVLNGHILDQTIWNFHFVGGSDKLSQAGTEKLDQLARRRPAPDPRVYLQTARDVPAAARAGLDTKRADAIKKYLGDSLAGRPTAIEVEVHDPAMPGTEGSAPRLLRTPQIGPATAGVTGLSTGHQDPLVNQSIQTGPGAAPTAPVVPGGAAGGTSGAGPVGGSGGSSAPAPK